jgi:hypothetical protein
MALTASQRSARARRAAYVRHSRTSGLEATKAAREGWRRRFLDEVDPERVLPEAERERRAALAAKAHMLKLNALSARARAKR